MTSLIDTGTEPPKGHPEADRVRRLYESGTRDIRDVQLQYQENASYLEGDQWIWRSSTRQEILRLPRPNPSKVRASIPRLGPESRRLFSKLLRRPLVFEVTPDAADDATIRGARVAEAVLTSKAREDKWDRIREEIAWAAWKGGTAVLCMDWDTNRGKYVGEGPTTGAALYEGDVRITPLTITEIATEPGTRDLERSCWWIKAQVLPPAEVKKTYGMSRTPEPNASAAVAPMQREIAKSGGQRAPDLCLVLTYYERPNKDNRNGTVMTVIGDQVVDGPHKWPFPFTDRLNLVCVREGIVEGRWYGRTVITDAVPIQTALNHSWTSVLEHLKQAGNARIQGNSVERNNADTWTDEAGEFVFYDTDPWAWLSPPSMPDWWSRVPGELAQAMDDAIGIHDVSRGQAPPNIESGLGISILAEQDDTPTGKFAQSLADAFGDLATLVLRTYEVKVVDEQRTITLYEPGAKIAERVTWSGQSFEGQTVARVPYEAVAPINEAARWARGLGLLDRQVITTPRQLSAYIDIPGGENFIESIDPNVSKARRENAQLAQQEPVVPADFDDHDTHIQEHNNFRLSARYERLDDRTRALIDMHVQAHSTLAAEEAAQQLAKMQGAPFLAQAAQGSQPPGSGTLAGMLGTPGMPEMGDGGMGPAPLGAVLGDREGGNPEETRAPDDDTYQDQPGMMM